MRQPLVTLILNIFIESLIPPKRPRIIAVVEVLLVELTKRAANARLEHTLSRLRVSGLVRSLSLLVVGLAKAAVVEAVTSFREGGGSLILNSDMCILEVFWRKMTANVLAIAGLAKSSEPGAAVGAVLA